MTLAEFQGNLFVLHTGMLVCAALAAALFMVSGFLFFKFDVVKILKQRRDLATKKGFIGPFSDPARSADHRGKRVDRKGDGVEHRGKRVDRKGEGVDCRGERVDRKGDGVEQGELAIRLPASDSLAQAGDDGSPRDGEAPLPCTVPFSNAGSMPTTRLVVEAPPGAVPGNKTESPSKDVLPEATKEQPGLNIIKDVLIVHDREVPPSPTDETMRLAEWQGYR
ncbi:MAG: hypothetical protein LBG81_00670 [Coriobacteriaceae bacterium]|jgi:hypothetical protein|nr:hypothetical protein [Coriobacteriaceae bacterium]